MTDVDDHGRPEPPLADDEGATLVGFLEFQRATLAWKCAGLDASGLEATIGASSMTLREMLTHPLAARARPRGDWSCSGECSAAERWSAPDPWSGRQWPTAAWRGWPGATRPDGRAPSPRWILCHMIEEYARHNGHADLLRESVDGLSGE